MSHSPSALQVSVLSVDDNVIVFFSLLRMHADLACISVFWLPRPPVVAIVDKTRPKFGDCICDASLKCCVTQRT